MKLIEAVAEHESLGERLVVLQEEIEVSKRRQSVLTKLIFKAVSSESSNAAGEVDFQVSGNQYRATTQKLERINEVAIMSDDMPIQ